MGASLVAHVLLGFFPYLANGMHVKYSVADVAEAERVFGALADGGVVNMPLAETFWSLRFGMCVDRFGTPWMVNVEAAEQTADVVPNERGSGAG